MTWAPLAVAALTCWSMLSCAGSGDEGETQPGDSADRYELVIVDGAADSAQAEEPDPEPAAVAAAADTGGVVQFLAEGTYTVQVAMYTDAALAAAEVKKLAASGYPAYGMARPDGRGVRVRIGYFGTREEADRFGRRFRADTGAEYWVDLRANEED